MSALRSAHTVMSSSASTARIKATTQRAAIAAAEAFFDSALEDDVVAEALSSIAVPGRFEIMQRNPLVVIDAAHNPEGARVATETLLEGFGDGRSRILVLGLLQGRDIAQMLDEFDAQTAEIVICCTADSPRAFTASEIAATARCEGNRRRGHSRQSKTRSNARWSSPNPTM